MKTNINLSNYEFDEQLLANVRLFDEVLEELGEPPLLENKNFSTFLDFPIAPHYLALEVVSKQENTLPITIWFEANDLGIDIDQIPETFEWSEKQINESKEKVTDLIRNLFTGYVLIETRGGSKFIQIFDANGFFVNASSVNNWLHFFTGLYLFRYKNYRRLYLPIFSKKPIDDSEKSPTATNIIA